MTQPAGMSSEEMGFGVYNEDDGRWQDLFPWLLGNGYRLRTRYEPGWIPSWKGKDARNAIHAEDSLGSWVTGIMDAIRVSDNIPVVLKQLDEDTNPAEIDIPMFLHSAGLKDDPRNHCISILEILQPPAPQYPILVLPKLHPLYKPRFETIGEILSCIKQLFDGMNFMHEHLVAHRDAQFANVMMDATPMYPQGWHFVREHMNQAFTGPSAPLSRTDCPSPVKYYFIDFDLGVRFQSQQEEKRTMPIMSGDKTAPELQGSGLFQEQNPFPTDVYYIGNLVRVVFFGQSDLFSGYRGLTFLHRLVADMTQSGPSKRPTMPEVVARFDRILAGLSEVKLRTPTFKKSEFLIVCFYRSWGRWMKSWAQWRKGIPALRLPNVVVGQPF